MRERGERQCVRLEREIVREVLIAPRHAAVARDTRDRLVAIVLVQIRVLEAYIEPGRVERRCARYRSLDFREERIQVLERAQIEGGDVDVETVERRDRGKEDVQFSLAARFGNRAGHVSILEDERRRLDLEMIERATRRPHVAGDLPLPVVRKLASIQR